MGYAFLIKDCFFFKVYDTAKVNHQDTIGNLVNISSQILSKLSCGYSIQLRNHV